MIKLVEYDQTFLKLSWRWLQDPELSKLTMTPAFTKEQQLLFYRSLAERNDYFIRGIMYKNERIGVAGIKNIADEKGEYFGYIGEKLYWGQGLGKFIMQSIIYEARALGLNILYLHVNSANERALNLYKRQGFETSSIANDILFMERSL